MKAKDIRNFTKNVISEKNYNEDIKRLYDQIEKAARKGEWEITIEMPMDLESHFSKLGYNLMLYPVIFLKKNVGLYKISWSEQ